MNGPDDILTWEDITTSVAEVRPLLTSFEILEETVEQQRRATKLTIFVLVSLLLIVLALLANPNAFSFGIREPVFAVGVVIAFGLVSTVVIYFNLLACGRNLRTARGSLEGELRHAEYSVNDTWAERGEQITSAGGGQYAA